MNTYKKLSTVLIMTSLYLTGCSNNPTIPTTSGSLSVKATKENVIANYENIVYANYQDSYNGVKNLQNEIDKFIANPTAEGLESAKSAWLKSRISYGQTEGYRFSNGPIDSGDNPEVRINSWPLDEVFIDYVDGNPNSGIINNPEQYPEITTDTLKALNQKGGDKNISVGFHAIEFLLWGQDLSDGPGAGQRQYTDYLTDGKGTNLNQDRRAKYLKAVTDLLVEDIKNVLDQWTPDNASNYRSKFTKMTPDEAITNILKGAGTLASSELSNQRMATPLEVGEKEEEHSCFSDSTQSDLLENTKSIQNIMLGKYTRTDGTKIEGPGIYDLIKQTKPELADKLKSQLDSSFNLVSSIKNPFDQEIRPDNKEGNKRVKDAINSLQSEGITIVDIGSAIGLNIVIEMEEDES